MKGETFLQIFGDIDEKYIEEAADDDGSYFEVADEGVVVYAGDPRKIFWRTFIASVACTAAVVVGAVFLMRHVLKSGVTFEPAGSVESSVQEGESSSGESEPSSESSVSSVPNDEIAFLIGPDGKAIRKSEITSFYYPDKTIETLTEDDIGAEIFCEGFAYYTEPCGIGYDSFKNPELFYGSDFIGEVPENKNEWKRVYVGDELFGLKVKSANTFFHIDDKYDFAFPARYFFDQGYSIQFEGTIEAEGLLQVNNHVVPEDYYNEMIYFYPTTIDLPLVPSLYSVDRDNGFETRFRSHVLTNANEFCYVGEFDPIILGNFNDASCDMDGLGIGDIAYARVTLGNIGYINGGIEATLEKVELLSGILDHVRDYDEPIYPVGDYDDPIYPDPMVG